MPAKESQLLDKRWESLQAIGTRSNLVFEKIGKEAW
jgi:hypothetical protein